MKKRKILSLVLSFALLFSFIVQPVAAAEIGSNGNFNEVTSDIIDLGELPKDGTPVTAIYSLNQDSLAKNSEYIIFNMTRSAIIWNVLGVPSNQIFIGQMSIMNISTGMSSGSNISMFGRTGIVSYIGIPGHTYHMSFYGSFWRTDSSGTVIEKVSDESGGWTWTVPIN